MSCLEFLNLKRLKLKTPRYMVFITNEATVEAALNDHFGTERN
jgi:hypothetical protein